MKALEYEIFDDREFYHHQLKEFLESRGAGGADRAADALAVARKRRSKRTGVDPKASKGRKLRYDTHPKLENFMFPVEPPVPPLNVDELFSSLLGQANAVRR